MTLIDGIRHRDLAYLVPAPFDVSAVTGVVHRGDRFRVVSESERQWVYDPQGFGTQQPVLLLVDERVPPLLQPQQADELPNHPLQASGRVFVRGQGQSLDLRQAGLTVAGTSTVRVQKPFYDPDQSLVDQVDPSQQEFIHLWLERPPNQEDRLNGFAYATALARKVISRDRVSLHGKQPKDYDLAEWLEASLVAMENFFPDPLRANDIDRWTNFWIKFRIFLDRLEKNLRHVDDQGPFLTSAAARYFSGFEAFVHNHDYNNFVCFFWVAAEQGYLYNADPVMLRFRHERPDLYKRLLDLGDHGVGTFPESELPSLYEAYQHIALNQFDLFDAQLPTALVG